MNRRHTPTRRLAAGLLATAGLLALTATGASAEDTEVTFTVDADGSGLSVSQATNTATVDDGSGNPVFDALSGAALGGTLPALTVTDARGSLLGAWTVQVSGEDWVNTSDSGVTVGAANGHVYLDVADVSALTTALGGALNGMVITGGEFNVGASDLSSAYTLLSGTTTLGNGSVVVTPAIDVDVPANTPVGTYTATVTMTVS